jgi:hypothetical protein
MTCPDRHRSKIDWIRRGFNLRVACGLTVAANQRKGPKPSAFEFIFPSAIGLRRRRAGRLQVVLTGPLSPLRSGQPTKHAPDPAYGANER